MKTRWEMVLLPSFLLVGILIVASQYVFLKGSFFKDLGLGRISDTATLVNYLRFFTDSFYLNTLWITVKTSALAALLAQPAMHRSLITHAHKCMRALARTYTRTHLLFHIPTHAPGGG